MQFVSPGRYKSLVPHALTAEEFWRQRKAELYAASQRQGFSSRRPTDAERLAAAESAQRAEREAAATAAAGAVKDEPSNSRKVCAALSHIPMLTTCAAV